MVNAPSCPSWAKMILNLSSLMDSMISQKARSARLKETFSLVMSHGVLISIDLNVPCNPTGSKKERVAHPFNKPRHSIQHLTSSPGAGHKV